MVSVSPENHARLKEIKESLGTKSLQMTTDLLIEFCHDQVKAGKIKFNQGLTA